MKFDRLGVNEKEKDNESSLKSWKYFKMYNDSIILDLFQGQYKCTIKCSNCGYKYISFDNYINLELPIPKKNSQIQIKFFKLNGEYFELNFNLDNNITIRNIIEEAINYLDEEEYLKSMFNFENDNDDYNESALFAKILYNSIEVVRFNNEYKIINIYKTDYNNINNNKNSKLYDNLKITEIFEHNINSELVLYERTIKQQEIYIYIYPTKGKKIPLILNYHIILNFYYYLYYYS